MYIVKRIKVTLSVRRENFPKGIVVSIYLGGRTVPHFCGVFFFYPSKTTKRVVETKGQTHKPPGKSSRETVGYFMGILSGFTGK